MRRRRVVLIGAAVATTLVTGLVVLVVGFFGSSAGHVPSFPGADAPAVNPTPHRSTGADVSPVPGGSQTPRTATTVDVTPTPAAASASPTVKRRNPSHPPRPTRTR